MVVIVFRLVKFGIVDMFCISSCIERWYIVIDDIVIDYNGEVNGVMRFYVGGCGGVDLIWG